MALDRTGCRCFRRTAHASVSPRTGTAIMTTRSTLLRTAFCRGMLQAVDLTGSIGTQRIRRMLANRTSRGALARDWAAVSHDLRTAMQRYAAEHGA